MLIARHPPPELFKLATNAWTQPFWDATARHELVAARCADCGTFRMPPTPFCPCCQSQSIDWNVLSGRGEVYSYTIVERAILPGMGAHLPYVPAVISLEGAGGTRLVSNVVDVPRVGGLDAADFCHPQCFDQAYAALTSSRS